ncbi:MAG: hypothetical protein HON90_14415, partial [Halobacteriovoraceae bacterium]|nr:hypothetical protein [Halobacteriovoraceae bacterium]
MQIEKNIAFIYPLSSMLKTLKEQLEQDDEYVVYELDSIAEYAQLIGVMEHSVTFSSNLKKTDSYLGECKKFVKNNNAKNFLIQDEALPSHIFSKLQRLGLNEIIFESTPLKTVLHKVNFFFKSCEQVLASEEEEKQKQLMIGAKSGNTVKANETEKKAKKYNANEKLRIEKMAVLGEDEEKGQLKKRRKVDLGFIIDSPLSNFELKPNKTDMSFLKSPFDNIQRKKVAQFDAVKLKSSLKRNNFKPVTGVLNRNPYKDLGLKPAGAMGKKSIIGLDLSPASLDLKRAQLDLSHDTSKARRKTFEEVQDELKRKKGALIGLANASVGKKRAKFEALEHNSPKRKKFEEVTNDLARKSAKFDEVEDQSKKKRKLFEEVKKSYDHKRKQLDD